jgi:ribosomal protein L7/L12
VAVVKAIREVAGYSLKEAIDAVNGMPSFIRYNTSWSREKAIERLVEAGATVQ